MKRRAENVLICDVPQKSFRSLDTSDAHFAGVHLVQNAGPSSLLTRVRHHCRKRPNLCVEEESHETALTLEKRTSTTRVNPSGAAENMAFSGRSSKATEPRSQGATVLRRTMGESKSDAGKVAHTEEDFSSFNSFQFWRVPLPDLDLSLLDSDVAPDSTNGNQSKEFEPMET